MPTVTLPLWSSAATRGEGGAFGPLLRPLGREPRPLGHFHAALFSHRTIPIGEINLKGTIATLFEVQHSLGVLHLLADYREPAGLGESEFLRRMFGRGYWLSSKPRGHLHDRIPSSPSPSV